MKERSRGVRNSVLFPFEEAHQRKTLRSPFLLLSFKGWLLLLFVTRQMLHTGGKTRCLGRANGIFNRCLGSPFFSLVSRPRSCFEKVQLGLCVWTLPTIRVDEGE